MQLRGIQHSQVDHCTGPGVECFISGWVSLDSVCTGEGKKHLDLIAAYAGGVSTKSPRLLRT